MSNRRRRVSVACGLIVFGGACGVAGLGQLQTQVPRFLLLYGAMFVAWAVVVWALADVHLSRRWLGFLFTVALAARAVLLPAEPALSTDFYRYQWEGRVVLDGGNPFLVAPDAAAVAHLRGRYHDRINHPHMATIYPPAAQLVFAAGSAISDSPAATKGLFALFDLGTGVVVLRILAALGLAGGAVVIWLWSPLVIVETAHSGHMDVVGVFFLLLALWGLVTRRWWLAGVSGGAAVLTKYLPLAFAPWLFRRGTRRVLVVGTIAVVAGFLPFIDAGAGLFTSLQRYRSEWQFNGALYELITLVWNEPAAVRRILTIMAAGFIVWWATREASPVRMAFVALAAVLLAAPTLYPWYLIWMLPLLCIVRSVAWLTLSGSIALTYLVWGASARTGVWEFPAIVWWVEYVPFVLLLAFESGRRRAGVSANA